MPAAFGLLDAAELRHAEDADILKAQPALFILLRKSFPERLHRLAAGKSQNKSTAVLQAFPDEVRGRFIEFALFTDNGFHTAPLVFKKSDKLSAR